MTKEELLAFAKEHVHERAAVPKYMEIMDELPKTAVGKIFKPALRKSAIVRIYNAALTDAGLDIHVVKVYESKKRGLVAQLVKTDDRISDKTVTKVLGSFINPWEWAD